MWPEIKTKYESLVDDVKLFLRNQLKGAISDEYLYDVCREIQDDVVADVMETSDYSESGTWNDDDIKLAVGRVLIATMGIDR